MKNLIPFLRSEPPLPAEISAEIAEGLTLERIDLIEGELYDRQHKIAARQERKLIVQRQMSELAEELRQLNLLIADDTRSISALRSAGSGDLQAAE